MKDYIIVKKQKNNHQNKQKMKKTLYICEVYMDETKANNKKK